MTAATDQPAPPPTELLQREQRPETVKDATGCGLRDSELRSELAQRQVDLPVRRRNQQNAPPGAGSGLASPAHSAMLQQFLRGRSDSSPSTKSLTSS